DLQYRAMLPPVGSSVWLNASVPSQDRYQFAITILDPFVVPLDLEPNDSAEQAQPLPSNLVVSGVADPRVPRGDADWYVIPDALAGQQVTVEFTAGASVAFWTAASPDTPSTTIPLISGTVSGSYLAQLPPGATALLQVTGSGPYRVALIPPGGSTSPMASPLVGATPGASPVASMASGVQVSLMFDSTPVAAYWSAGQRLDGTLTLTNRGDQEVSLNLEAKTGNAFWQVVVGDDTGKTPIALAPGQSRTVPVVVHVAPDAWADQPIYVAVRATDNRTTTAHQASAFALVTPDRNAPPLNSEPYLPLPKPLLGGLDVAWTGLGATPIPSDTQDPTVISQLFDQSTITGTGWRAAPSELPQEITVQLAGASPVPVVGIVLDPRGLDDLSGNQLKDFDLELSMDGQTFTPVLSGTLSIIPTEQSFVLGKAVPARFARLRVKSAQSASASSVVLGEWKVIAQPGWQPAAVGTPAAAPAGLGLDVSGPNVGGHLVDMQPQFSDPTTFQMLITADQTRQTLDLMPGAPISWVTGFHEDRAAQITELQWQDPPESDPAARFDKVQVEISLDSPAGPWTDAGTWTLDRASGEPTFAFAQPTWSRFVRLSGVKAVGVQNATPTDTTVMWELPNTVHVYERMPDDSYRSILGEWGASSSTAIYEHLVPPAAVALAPDVGNDASHATILPLGSRLTNTAAVGSDEDWYQVEVPAGMGQLAITMRGDPTLDVALTMFDEGGKQMEVAASVSSPQETTFRADVIGGKRYFLRVVQPPTSVIFAFDTSGSIGPFVTTVYQGLGQYAAAVQPGKEVVNILPYGEHLLLPQWTDQPYVLQGAIASYPRTAGSSDSEGSMLTAIDALQGRDGQKAIVLITDAESSPTREELLKLWPELATVKPRIFTIHIVGGGDPAHSTDLMQDWAKVNNGEYVYVRDQGEMDIAFDRAATILRRPTVYSVGGAAKAAATPTPMPTATSTPMPLPTSTPLPTATPEPTPAAIPLNGSLQIVAPTPIVGQPTTAQVADNASVAIIFDTSGSMLQGLENSTRADIAKQSLTQLVMQTIPPGTTVSLRTFGDTPDSCETRLVVPAGPLDPAAMSSTIQDVPIVDLVRTPIGASLQQVSADLGTGAGPKIVVLVTDGEETCGGDPEAAIRALIATGIDVHVNIVGFALDDAQLKATFANWAQLGNGRYIDAGNAAELDAAVSAAVLPTFRVVDAQGMIVASGQVGGDPITVPAGTYTVVVASNPGQQFTSVTISPEQTTTLDLQAPSSRTDENGEEAQAPQTPGILRGQTRDHAGGISWSRGMTFRGLSALSTRLIP
ncbi:MAG: VWA domain-containing protein, partial [Thermomicrobiales bacterium]